MKNCLDCDHFIKYQMDFCVGCKGFSNHKETGIPSIPTSATPLGSAKTSSHYQVGQKQPIEIMQEVMTKEEFVGFLRGSIIKYSLRFGYKDEELKEAGKIEQYSKWLRLALEGKKINPME